jgi:hypothetical protein
VNGTKILNRALHKMLYASDLNLASEPEQTSEEEKVETRPPKNLGY